MPKLAEFLKVRCIAHLTAILDKLPGSFQIGGQYKVAIGQQHTSVSRCMVFPNTKTLWSSGIN
jgi:hypothetical protein